MSFNVSENTGADARTRALTIAGLPFTVAQQGREPCAFLVEPQAVSFEDAGGSGRIDVTTGSGCAWTASSGDGWIVVTAVTTRTGCAWTATPGAPWLVLRSGTSGAGAGTIRFEVGTFTKDATRRAAVAVRWPTPTAGQNVWVEQEGCRYGLTAAGAAAPVAGGPGEVFVVSQPVTSACGLPCPWATESQASWILITSSPTKSGDDAVRYVVAANATGAERVGTIRIQEMTYTITQAGQ